MKKEGTTQTIKDLESTRLTRRSYENVPETDEEKVYEWVEDALITGKDIGISVDFKKTEDGYDSATVIRKSPNKSEGADEIIYYTTQEVEVNRLKALSEGKTIIVEIPEKE